MTFHGPRCTRAIFLSCPFISRRSFLGIGVAMSSSVRSEELNALAFA